MDKPTPEEIEKLQQIEKRAQEEGVEIDNEMGLEDFEDIVSRAVNDDEQNKNK